MAGYMNWKKTVEWLYHKHAPSLHRRAGSVLFDRNKVPDLLQELFTRLLEKDRQMNSREEAEKYLFRAFRNLLIDYVQRDVKWKYADLSTLEHPDLATKAHQEEDLVKERSKDKKLPLPDPDRGIFELAYFEGKKDVEIAEMFGLKISTVRYCLNKSRKILTEILAGSQGLSSSEIKSYFSRRKG
jgi:RNA polymerase sigma-70 factor (ECF subfamily)